MEKQTVKKSVFKAGKYLLETLTTGMYNNPLSIYREYVQNASDSIDIALKTNPLNSKKIQIDIDPSKKSITIHDNGAGISADLAENILSSVGLSAKTNQKLRGFRGIGRLGGLAFCDKAVFRTKAEGEEVESIQEWDCNKLKYLISDSGKQILSLKQLFNNATTFYLENGKKKAGSYFEVNLYGVQGFRNHMMDIKKVYDFLSVTAPVPFNPETFLFANEINYYLSSKLFNYSFYDIILNGEPIYKPYCNILNITSKGYDTIDAIETFNININGSPVAYGWYGKRRELLGAMAKSEMASGIRVRVGNIQIGDNHLLDGCYRESRFNSYMVGEIHIDSENLIPNSRRDDFIDNEDKSLFYDAVERQLGISFSKEIRHRSRLRSNKYIPGSQNVAINNNQQVEAIPTIKQEKTTETLTQLYESKIRNNETELLAVFQKECKDCPVLRKITERI